MKTKPTNVSGARIARHRRRLGLTQLELSKALARRGVRADRAAVAKIENGLRRVLDFELAAMAAVLGVPPGKLLGLRAPRGIKGAQGK